MREKLNGQPLSSDFSTKTLLLVEKPR